MDSSPPPHVDDDRRRFVAMGAGVLAANTLASRIDLSSSVSSDDEDGEDDGSEDDGDAGSDDEDHGGDSESGPGWRTRGFDVRNTSYNPETTGPTERGRPKWHFWEYTTGPAVADGTVYVGGQGRWVGSDEVSDGIYAVDAEVGELEWETTFEDVWFERPTVADSTVYAFGSEDVLYALDAETGEERWRYGDLTNVDTPVVADGLVLLSGHEGLVALDAATGGELWRYDADHRMAYSPAVGDGLAFVSEGDWNAPYHRLHAFDAATGERRWSYDLPDDCNFVDTAPTVGDGVVYVGGGSHDVDDGMGLVVALDVETGERVWSWVADNPMNQAMALAHDTLYVPVKGAFTALDAETGEVRWQFAIDPTDRNPMARIDRFSPPAVVGDTVYVGGYDAALYALDARTGECRWRYAFGRRYRASSQPAVADGRVYVNCYFLHAFEETGDAAVKANFVFQNTGRGVPRKIRVGRRVTFWARFSRGPIARYEWDLTGDGTVDATGQFANHVYDEPGTKTATLRVVGEDGRVDAIARTVNVRPEEEGGR